MSYTKGPWYADEPSMGFSAILTCDGDGLVFGIASGGDENVAETDEEITANAHLIAAAPELLEALEGITLFHESGGHEGDAESAIATARAIIAKAKGETQ